MRTCPVWASLSLNEASSPLRRRRSIVFSETPSRRAASRFEIHCWLVAIARRTYERPERRSELLACPRVAAKTDGAGLHWTRACSHGRSHGRFSAS